MYSQFFVNALENSKSRYFLWNKNIDFSKNKMESKLENVTETLGEVMSDETCVSVHRRIAN